MLFFGFSSTIGYYKILSTVPCAIDPCCLSILYVAGGNVNPNPLLPFSPLVTTSLSSTFVSLFLL